MERFDVDKEGPYYLFELFKSGRIIPLIPLSKQLEGTRQL